MGLQMAGSGQTLPPELSPVSTATGRNCCWVTLFMASQSWQTESATLLVIFMKILSISDIKGGICPAHSFKGVQSTYHCGEATRLGREVAGPLYWQSESRESLGWETSQPIHLKPCPHELCPSARLHPLKGPELSKAAPTVVDSIQTCEPVGHVIAKP